MSDDSILTRSSYNKMIFSLLKINDYICLQHNNFQQKLYVDLGSTV